ncbi:MAG TPA: hypothetical protein DCW31_09640 [Lactobacillus sp.]|nr:hypothetical protein [Lactobacillus sp.]
MIKSLFIGYLTPRDERQMGDINNRLAGLYILSFYLLGLATAVSLGMDLYFEKDQISRGTVLLTVLMMVNALVYIVRFWHAESVTSETFNALNKRQVVHHLQMRTFGQSLYFFILMTAWVIFMNSWFNTPEPISKTLLTTGIESIAFGLIMYVVGRVKIHE